MQLAFQQSAHVHLSRQVVSAAYGRRPAARPYPAKFEWPACRKPRPPDASYKIDSPPRAMEAMIFFP